MARPKKLPEGMKQRGKTYYAWFTAHGRQFRKSLSKDFDTACIMLNDMRAKADREDYGILNNDYKWTELKSKFFKWAAQSLRNPKEKVQDIATIERYLTPTNIRQITPQFVIGFREWRLAQRKRRKNREGKIVLGNPITPRTVNKEVGTLRHMLNKGVEWRLIGHNPITGIKPLRHDTPTKQRRALTMEEVERLFAASPEWLRPVWRMFLTTGIRRDELVNLTFDDVDFERKVITIRAEHSKNHKAREIPIDDEMMNIITKLRDEAPFRRPMRGKVKSLADRTEALFSKDHVFVTTTNTPLFNCFLGRFYACCKRAGIEDAKWNGSVDIHSLRVTFASMAIENGANPKAVQAILGHSTLSLTMDIYTKASEQSKRDTIGKLPFTRITDPAHIVRFKAHKSGSSNPDETQSLTAIGV